MKLIVKARRYGKINALRDYNCSNVQPYTFAECHCKRPYKIGRMLSWDEKGKYSFYICECGDKIHCDINGEKRIENSDD